MAATTADLVNRFIELDEQRKAKEGEVDAIKEELKLLEPLLMERFENAGMQSMKSRSGVTVYISRKLWASPKEGNHAGLVAALQSIGLNDMVKTQCNTQTLSAYIREREQELFGGKSSPDELTQKLPEEIRPFIAITEKFDLKARKS